MNNLLRGGVLLALALLMTGCASTGDSKWYDELMTCALAGGVAGAGLSVASDGDEAPAIVSAAGGAIVGGLFCGALSASEPWEQWTAEEGDTDGDGVVNSRDRCPDTAHDVKVGTDGCELDSDGDGIVNRVDKCPNSPRGVMVGDNGCEIDMDDDGVGDSLDRCPNTPPDTMVDRNGCELDSDDDGIVNSLDRCPGTPMGTTVDNSGCKLAERFTLEGVNFHHDSARLTDDSVASLDDAVRILVRHADLLVEVAGHTDSQGSAQYNLDLSDQRAISVRDFLISRGANPGNLTAKGYGESEPVADNTTSEGRAMNRRVELRHD